MTARGWLIDFYVRGKKVFGDAVKGCCGGVGDLWVGLQGYGQKISIGQKIAFFLKSFTWHV
jgi:hypothetical protein